MRTFFLLLLLGLCSLKGKEGAVQLYQEGNYAESLELCLQQLANPETPTATVLQIFPLAIRNLNQLRREHEFDALCARVLATYPQRWEIYPLLARALLDSSHYGGVADGVFWRGHNRRQQGRYVTTQNRDRLQALQWLARGRELLEASASATPNERGSFYLAYGRALLDDGNAEDSWRLLHLTDWSVLPDYGDVDRDAPPNADLAPVDAAGNPLFFAVPESFAAARNDGERWRWLWAEAARQDAGMARVVAREMANYARNLYSVTNLFGDDALEEEQQPDAIHSWLQSLPGLADDETVVRLPSGIRRFRLPDDYNFMRIYRQLGDFEPMAIEHEHRRQFPAALACWQEMVRQGHQRVADAVARISANRGQFLPVAPQRYGEPVTVTLRYRNAPRARFTLHRVDMKGLLDEACQRLRSGKDGHGYLPLQDLGDYLMRPGTPWIGAEVARWEMPLQPPADHNTTTALVTVPVPAPGAYWLIGQLPGGHVSRIPLLVDAQRLLVRQISGEMLWQVLREEDGHGVLGARLTMLAYRQKWEAKRRRNLLEHRTFTGTTDANGQFFLAGNQLPDPGDWQFFGMAEGPDGTVCALYPAGFTMAAVSDGDELRSDDVRRRNRGIVITDRPVYRPGDRVHFKIWRQQIDYAEGAVNPYALAPTGFVILDPTGEKVYSSERMLEEQPALGEVLRTDAFGGLAGSFQLPAGARLGRYRLNSEIVSASFRVEEYRNPEYEVTVGLPEAPLRLGDRFPVEVRARYYFGAPVTSGTVEVKVYRRDHTPRLWPVGRWDWLYGNGYAWLGVDAPWLPGWNSWGTPAPRRNADGLWWWPENPPELVCKASGELDADGIFKLDIDTVPALRNFADRDHAYAVEAEVRDASRREISGRGEVLAVRRPYRAAAWTDGGHYRVGDSVLARLRVQLADGRPAAVLPLTLKLLRCRYPGEGEVIETPVREWQLHSDADGLAAQPLTAAEPGQYRLVWSFADGETRQESGCLLQVYGEAPSGSSDFRYQALELIPDKSEYRPGEQVRLRLNVSRPGAMVLLFVRTVNGIARRPQVLRLQERSHEVTLAVTPADYPNFFVEAATLWHGEWHSVLREIAVPPEKKLLQVDVAPAEARQRPGETARVALQVRDAKGEPFAGSLVCAVYDKSVEAIASGSIPDILPAFWNWKRHSYAPWQLMNWTLDNATREKEATFESIGFSEFFLHTGSMDGIVTRRSRRGMHFGPPRELSAPGMMRKGGAEMDGFMAVSAMAPASMEAQTNGGGGDDGESGMRQNFADTAYWAGALAVAVDGTQTLEFPWPDALTTWKIRVWAKGVDGQVGCGEAEVCISKEVMLRLQAPRFLVEGDEAILSAVLHNFLDRDLTAPVSLALAGDALALLPGHAAERQVTIPAGGELRVDWPVRAQRAATVSVGMRIAAGADSDGMRVELPVQVYGAPVRQSWSGLLESDGNVSEWQFTLPEAIRAGSQRLQVNCSPSLALAMLEALPYLLDYPYGCTEQTLNRFLPAVVTRHTLASLGISLEEIAGQRSRLNAQALDGSRLPWIAHPAGKAVFDSAEMDKIVAVGLRDLEQMQCGDGGWGWFSGYGERSSPYFTALVLHGLHRARQAGLTVPENVWKRGLAWLQGWQQEQISKLDNAQKKPRVDPWRQQTNALDALVFQVLAEAGTPEPKMADYLFRDRLELGLYGKGLLALGLPGDDPRVPQLMRNLNQFLQRDNENQTAYLLEDNSGCWWNWYGDGLEIQAVYLRLLLRGGDTERLAPRLVKYLLNNRRHGGYWRSTRTTAMIIEAFAEYVRITGEGSAEQQVEVLINGRRLGEVRLNRDNLLTADSRWLLEGAALPPGPATLTIRKVGDGPLYCNAYLDYFSREEEIPPAGLEVKIERRLYRLSEETAETATLGSDGQPLHKRVVNLKRTPLAVDEPLRSGDRIEVELLIESKNDYEHILVEDYKAAGLEAEAVLSGYHYGALGAYIEYRNDRVALFLAALPRGRHALRYTLRAETPGRYVARPAQASGFYAPELRANSAVDRLRIND